MLMTSPFLITLFVVEGIILFFGLIAFVFSIIIYKNYDFNENTTYQYNLAKCGYLVSTIIFFILCIKLPLFLFFVWAMDSVSALVPGAMCAAGILDATKFGVYMFGIKILNLFFLSGWLLINHEDSKTKNSIFLITKFRLFVPIFILLVAEFILEFLHFSGISLTEPVLCCSDIFKANDIGTLKFWHTDKFILTLFYMLFILNFISAYYKVDILVGIFSLFFIFSTIYAIIRFFSPYIYQLPTHKCPFCMLQSDYHYVGYFIYILIFIGAIPGFFLFIFEIIGVKPKDYWYKISMYANALLVVILSYFPLFYYFKNGVWL